MERFFYVIVRPWIRDCYPHHDRAWEVHIPELRGVTQAMTTDDISDMAKDYISLSLGLPLDQIGLVIAPDPARVIPKFIQPVHPTSLNAG